MSVGDTILFVFLAIGSFCILSLAGWYVGQLIRKRFFSQGEKMIAHSSNNYLGVEYAISLHEAMYHVRIDGTRIEGEWLSFMNAQEAAKTYIASLHDV